MAVQTITAIADIIKNAYLPAFENQLTTEASPFLEKIKKVPLMSNDIVASAPVGFNGGVGFGGPESAATPDSGPQLYKGFRTQAHDLYCNIEISDKAVKLASNNQGAMMNALDHEIKSAYTAAEFNLGRVLFGNGTGILASITATASAATTIYVSDCVTVREGMIIDAYANASATASGTTPATAGARVLAVNREFLQHDYYTDVITFDYTTAQCLNGDIFISLDTVRSNAEMVSASFEHELLRILIHGVLHLTGQADKTPETKTEMTRKEEEALLLIKN